MPAANAAKRQRWRREDRRRQLLDVASRLMASDGAGALTMERLAEVAGVSKPVVYSHFENRSALLLAVLEDYWAAVDDASVRRLAEAGESFDAQLRAAVGAYFDAIAERGSVLRMVLGERSGDAAVDEARHRRHERLRERYKTTVRSMGIPDEMAGPLAAIILRASEAVSDYWIETGEDRDVIEHVYVTTIGAALRQLRRQARRAEV